MYNMLPYNIWELMLFEVLYVCVFEWKIFQLYTWRYIDEEKSCNYGLTPTP